MKLVKMLIEFLLLGSTDVSMYYPLVKIAYINAFGFSYSLLEKKKRVFPYLIP